MAEESEVAALDDWFARVEEAWKPLRADKEIGARVRAIREGAGLSQRPFAASIGVNQVVLSRIENGERRLSFPDAIEIALTYRVALADLVASPVAALLAEIDRP